MQYRAVWTSRMKQVLVLQRPLSGYGSALEEQAWCGYCQRASKPLLCGPTFYCYQHHHLLDVNLLAWSVYYTKISLCGVYLPTQELISQYCLIYSTSWISSSPPQRDGGPMLLSLPSWEWGWLHSELSSPNGQKTVLAQHLVFGLFPGPMNWTRLACYQVTLRNTEIGERSRRKPQAEGCPVLAALSYQMSCFYTWLPWWTGYCQFEEKEQVRKYVPQEKAENHVSISEGQLVTASG